MQSFKMYSREEKNLATAICKNCGVQQLPKKINAGSGALELILYLFFLIPGVIYSCWRVSNSRLECCNCKSKDIVGIDTPIGKNLIEQLK